MVAVFVAFAAAFLIWFHNDPEPQPSEHVCRAPETVLTTTMTGPWHEEVRIEVEL